MGVIGWVYSAILVDCPRRKPTGPAPEIDKVEPETGVPGRTDITIYGTHFGEIQGTGYVGIGSQNGVVKSWSETKIVATIAAGAHQGGIYVQQGELASNVIKFVPIGIFVDGASGRLAPGKEIRLMGSGFGSAEGSGYVTVGDVKAEVLSWSDREIVLTAPDRAMPSGVVRVTVHQNGKSADFPMISFNE